MKGFTPAGGKNMDIRKSEFVTKTQFLSRGNRIIKIANSAITSLLLQ